jgi:hypothetical protein
MNTSLKRAWAGRAMRLDPFDLPDALSYTTRDDQGEVHYSIDKRGAVIRRVLEMSELPVTIAIPARLFRGVAASASEDGEGKVTVTLELHHNDPQLSVPLLVADHLDDIAADWRAWAEAYRLPMLLIEADGVARSLEESLGAALRIQQSKERRQGKATKQRRTRFQMHRKGGNLGLRLIVDGREIISRD